MSAPVEQQFEFIEIDLHGLTIQQAFEAFHDAHPWVYRRLVDLARDYIQSGAKRVSIKMLFEVLRWQWRIATKDRNSQWALNNNYSSRYARLIATTEPDLSEAFECRELRAA